MIRMLATDLDGTLLRPDLTVSPRTVAALAAARERDFPVVFATGRPPRWMLPVVEETGHAGVAVCANGALLVDLDAGDVLQAHPLEQDLIIDVADALRDAVPGTSFATEFVPVPLPAPDVGPEPDDGVGRLVRMRAYGHEPGYLPFDDPRYGPLVASMPELVATGPVVKLLARAPEQCPPDHVLEIARRVTGTAVEVTHSMKSLPLLEISAQGVSKASALAAYAASLGIGAHEVATVGDMPNDVAMLRWAGQSYAIEGSHQDALAAARHRAAPAEQDGVAQLLETLLAARPVSG